MKKITSFILTACCGIFILSSCQKEINGDLPGSDGGDANTGSILGNWKFVNMQVKSDMSVSVLFDGEVDKIVTDSYYSTINNSGTMKINADSMIIMGVGYSIDTTIASYSYTDGVLDDSTKDIFQYSIPPYNSSSAYKQITADSIYFPGGQLLNISGVTTATTGAGVKLKFDGNKMSFLNSINQVTTDTGSGYPVTTVTKATAIMTFQRQ